MEVPFFGGFVLVGWAGEWVGVESELGRRVGDMFFCGGKMGKGLVF